MEKRSIQFYWLLILIPAIIISTAAFRLIYHEQERINTLESAAVEERTRAIADTLQVTVQAVEDQLARAMQEIPEAQLNTTLLDWEENNPLVRNVFIWSENQGLIYPEKGLASISEERNFIARFDGLFSGRIKWPYKNPDSDDNRSGSSNSGLLKDVQSLSNSRKELLEIAKTETTASYRNDLDSLNKEPSKSGWIPWFAENKLYILGWVNRGENKPVYGVELELMTLLSRLINSFPEIPSGASGYALVDDSGRMLHQVGNIDSLKDSTPELSISLAPHLPHWSLAVYTAAASGSNNSFMILACLLLVIFIAAIASGGFLLMRHAKQNMLDAQQKTSFVSNVSHELKTPLTSIRMFAELLMEGRVKDKEKTSKYLGIIVTESRRLTRLVNNVLDFGRLEQENKKYHFEDIDAAAFLKETVEFHSPRIKDAEMECVIDIPDEEIKIKTDRDALEQVILNLIDNAVKYAAAGKEILISMKQGTADIEIRVEDRGPGIPEAHRKKIFEKFHRVDDTLTSKTQGSGLGLSIAKKMINATGGDIYYEQRQGGGSSFVVKLPLR